MSPTAFFYYMRFWAAEVTILSLIVVGLGVVAGYTLDKVERELEPPTESICTMDGEQAREFARQCKATGGELSIYEYTCKQTDN